MNRMEQIASGSMHYAHLYRTGIFGYLIFGGCGVHVPCLSSVFVYKHLMEESPDKALELSLRFGMYFLLPAMILFLIFWVIQSYAQIAAFAKGLTPYPRWCWIFCLPVGQALTMLLKFTPETALRNALTAGWISIANIWTMGGLLITMKKARRADKTWKEYEAKSKGRTKEEHAAVGKQMMDIFAEFGAISHTDPASEEARKLVRKLQSFITDNLYTCSDEILCSLGKFYGSGGEMTANIDKYAGEGAGAFACEAIQICCGK